MGGLKAVVWTDALQSVFTLGSVIFIVVLGYIKIGSVSRVYQINNEGNRLELFNMNLDPFQRNTFWTFVIGEISFFGAAIAVHPGAVQRFIAVPTLRDAKLVVIWSCIMFFVIKILVVNFGILVYANYHDCDPVATKMHAGVPMVGPMKKPFCMYGLLGIAAFGNNRKEPKVFMRLSYYVPWIESVIHEEPNQPY